MKTNRSFTTTLAAALLALVFTAHHAPAQVVTDTRTGNLGLSGGPSQGYAFIKQMLVQGRAPEISIELTPVDRTIPPDNWTWKMSNPSDNGLKSLLKLKWYGQAACPDDLTLLQVTGPGGTLTQNPLSNPIWGYFNAQSFTVDTVKNVCIEWADDNTCDPAEPGCQLYETFDLVGGVAPATAADQLRLKASCTSGPVANTDYVPVLRVYCHRGL